MKLSLIGRIGMALFASLALGLGMTACGGGTIAYMWVLGQQYNNIAGFKVDDYTGNLTQIIESPFDSNGAVPVSIVIKSGGRFVYVINQGTCPTAGCGSGFNVSQTIALFSVGGDGTLNFQQKYQSQGYDSQWAQMDSSGTYLYVLDKYAPAYDPKTNLYDLPNPNGTGSITAFAADPTTGRLSLITNAQTLTPAGVNKPFWDVGASPFMMKASSGCLFTANGADQTISPYAVGASGQLTFTTTGIITTKASKISSITGGGSYIFLTDAGSNSIDIFTIQSCNLVAPNGGGITANFPGTSNPNYAFLDSTSQYLYVLNQSTMSTQVGTPYSSISAYTLNPANQELQPIAGAPYTVGSGPVCMVEDSTNQYLYTSNHNDGTVTGQIIDQANGTLAPLRRGSTFPSVGLAGCVALSGAID